jgi:hypothetical protein
MIPPWEVLWVLGVGEEEVEIQFPGTGEELGGSAGGGVGSGGPQRGR